MGLPRTAGIAIAMALALCAVAVPGAPGASAAEAGASEEYRVTGSGFLSYSARIVASEDYLTKRVCVDFTDRLRTVFGLAKDPKTSYTEATYSGGTSECTVPPFDIHPTDSVITENGSERTISMSSSTTGPVLAAIGFTTRSATATVSNAIITSASDGCAIDHDSSSTGQETATCTQAADDLYVTYDVATGATSSGAVRGAPTPVPPGPEARARSQSPSTPSTPAATTTPGPITAPVTVGNPGQRGGAPTPTGRHSGSDDHDAFVSVFFLIIVILVLIGIISMGTMRSHRTKHSRRTARSRSTPARPPVDRTRADPGDPTSPYGSSGTSASDPHDSPAPALESEGPSEAAAPRSDSRFAPPSDPT